MSAKSRNPADSTLRNVRAVNKKLAALTVRVKALETKMRERKR